MKPRQQALDVLCDVRELLAERLTERLLETADDLFDDARGDSFHGEIEQLYEQFGTKLALVNQLIANFPVPPSDPDQRPLPEVETSFEIPTHGDADVATAKKLKPRIVNEINFQTFAQFIRERNTAAAGEVLAQLLNLPSIRAEECAKHFLAKWQADPRFLERSMDLRAELASGSTNGVMVLLWECFGLQGIESMVAVESLKSRN